MSPEDAITHALLRWVEPISRNARAIAKAALAALDGHAYAVEPVDRTTTVRQGLACEARAAGGSVELVFNVCPCCGQGETSVRFSVQHADSLGADLQAVAAQARADDVDPARHQARQP